MEFQLGVMLRGQYEHGADMVAKADEMIEQAKFADQLGYASITKGSHYSTDAFQAFQQFPVLARLSGEVKQARLNAGIVLLPLHKPLDIAEQLATIDILSNGRLIFGVGLGYREVEFKAFGMTQKQRGKRLTENLIAIKRLWSEDKVSMVGSHFELDEAVCWPKPVQKPNPPIWIGGNADVALKARCSPWRLLVHQPAQHFGNLQAPDRPLQRLLGRSGQAFPDRTAHAP